jgi:aspartyl-tRNA(Asn)/glutamyl-tRNA(Gln) amidotransferase subunit C
MSTTPMTLSADEVRRIARLARLGLTDAEVAALATQLTDVLRYAGEIQAVDTSRVTPTSHACVPEGVWRDDTPLVSLPAEALVDNAPDVNAEPLLFRVPKVIG